jgi:hypothetical protein
MSDLHDPPRDAVALAPRPIDWLLLGRYALLISLCALIPVPLLDRWVENALRRRLVRAVGLRHSHRFEPLDASRLGDAESGGCLGLLWSIVAWPVKKVLKTLSVVFQVKGIADAASEVMHRGLMLEEAFEAGWLPGDAGAVREAMDKALAAVDTRPVERRLMGSLRDLKSDLNLAIWETVRIARARLASRPAQALADAADSAEVGPGIAHTTRAMAASLQTSALVPEVLAWFRAEMGAPPRLEPKLLGPIDPELVDPDRRVDPEVAAGLPAPIEDAVEVRSVADEPGDR